MATDELQEDGGVVGVGIESAVLIGTVGNRNIVGNEVSALVDRASYVVLERDLGITADSERNFSLAVKKKETGAVGFVEVHVFLVVEHGHKAFGVCPVAGEDNGSFRNQKCVGILTGVYRHSQCRQS